MTAKTVSIMGAGWLGLALAHTLIRQKYHVKGSTTTEAKIPLLRKSGIQPYLIKCTPQLSGEKADDFFKADILILNIPFERSQGGIDAFKMQIDAILFKLQLAPIDFVIFTSSTSVYPSINGVVTEAMEIIPENNRAKILLQVERNIRMSIQFDTTILRLGGLCGYDRAAGSGSTEDKNGDGPVNLIHRDDCVKIISEIIRRDVRTEIFNAVCDEHPTRRELYTKIAEKKGQPAPVFSSTAPLSYKIASNQKLKNRLDFIFEYPNPVDFK